MNKVLEELKKTGVFYIATIDGDKPKVRPFGSCTEFEGNIYICTNSTKDVYKQIMDNPNIELCGMNKDNEWIRLSAVAVLDDRLEPKKAILSDPTGPSSLYKYDDEIFKVFKLENVNCVKYSFTKEPEIIK